MLIKDDLLIQRCLSGEKDAFGALVDKYKDAVYGLAYSKVGNFHDAQDIAQEAFIDAYRNLRSLKYPHRFRSWIYTIAANRCRMWMRKHLHTPLAFGFVEDSGTVTDLQDQAIRQSRKGQMLDGVLDAINGLPSATRLVMTLYYIDGLTCKEISEFTGTSINTVMSKLRRAREKLRKEFTEMPAQTMTQQQIHSGFTSDILGAIEQISPSLNSPPNFISRIMRVPWVISMIIGLIATGVLYINAPDSPKDIKISGKPVARSVLSEEMRVVLINNTAELIPSVEPKKNLPHDIRAILWKIDGKEVENGEQHRRVTGDTVVFSLLVPPKFVLGEAKSEIWNKSEIWRVIDAPDSDNPADSNLNPDEIYFKYGKMLYGTGGIQLWYRYDDDLYPGGIDDDYDCYPDNNSVMNSRYDGIDNDWDGIIDEPQKDKDGNDTDWAEVNTWRLAKITTEIADTGKSIENNSKEYSEASLIWDTSDLEGEFQYQLLLVVDPEKIDPDKSPGRPFERSDVLRSKIIIDHQNSYVYETIVHDQISVNISPGDILSYDIHRDAFEDGKLHHTTDGYRSLIVTEARDEQMRIIKTNEENISFMGHSQKVNSSNEPGYMYINKDGSAGSTFETEGPMFFQSELQHLDGDFYFAKFPSGLIRSRDTWVDDRHRDIDGKSAPAKYTVSDFERIKGIECVILEREQTYHTFGRQIKSRIACDVNTGMIIKLDSEVNTIPETGEGSGNSILHLTAELTDRKRLDQKTLLSEKQVFSEIEAAYDAHRDIEPGELLIKLEQEFCE